MDNNRATNPSPRNISSVSEPEFWQEQKIMPDGSIVDVGKPIPYRPKPIKLNPPKFTSMTLPTFSEILERRPDVLNNATTEQPTYPNMNPKKAKGIYEREFIRYGYDKETAKYLANLAFEEASGKLSPDAAIDKWYNSNVYKEKFGWINEQRKKINPSAVDLTSDEIIRYSNEVKDMARRAGLPSTFWDNNTFASKALAGDQSIYEISDRIKVAADFVNNQDDYFKQAARELGIPLSDMVAYSLDPELGLPAIQRDYRASQLLAETKRAGLATSKDFVYQMEGAQITAGRAREASTQVALQTGTLGKLAAIEGDQALTEEEQLGAKLELNEEAIERERGLRSRERARFSGTGAGTRMFSRNMSGSI